MDRLPKRETRTGRPPHVGKPVIDYLTSHPDAPTEDEALVNLGLEQGDLVRYAIRHADRLRRDKVDPGDAFLAGIRLASAAIGEQMEREEFVRRMLAGSVAGETTATGGGGA